jgi:molybdopterin synthase catalytic subunit
MSEHIQRMGEAPLDINALLALSEYPDCGGLALFAGAVRNHHEGKSVQRLIYSAYLPVCERLLADIEAEAKAKFGVSYIAVRHRVGELAIGELAIVCVVQAPHRAEAFAALPLGGGCSETRRANLERRVLYRWQQPVCGRLLFTQSR